MSDYTDKYYNPEEIDDPASNCWVVEIDPAKTYWPPPDGRIRGEWFWFWESVPGFSPIRHEGQ